tara:strand:+ start:3365 stop:4459 length:1095 start_codon:yes stop_codon:yes gene_type:complete
MKLILENWNNFLSEEILPFKNMARAYHSFGVGSTGAYEFDKNMLNDVVRSIHKEGFKPGEGQLYGKGIYTVYDPHDLNVAYGKYCLVFDVENLDKFLIFSYREAKKVYGKLHKMTQQLEKNGIEIDDELRDLCDKIDTLNRAKHIGFTSRYALNFSKNPKIKDNVRGLIFEGAQDGKVLVGYFPKDFKLVGYGEVHARSTTSYQEFLLSKDFITKMSAFYRIKDERIEPKRFFTIIGNSLTIQNKIWPDFNKIKNNLRMNNNSLKDSAYENLQSQIFGPKLSKLYDKFEKLQWSDANDDEIEKLEHDMYENHNLEEKELEFEKLQFNIALKEAERFFNSGFYQGMLRRFKLDDDKFVKNIKYIK